MDFVSLKAMATRQMTSKGLPMQVTRTVVETRNGLQETSTLSVGKGHGVVFPSKRNKQQGSTASTPLDIPTKTIYMTSDGKMEPAIGDTVTSKQGEWQIVGIEEYKPAALSLAFVFEVQ